MLRCRGFSLAEALVSAAVMLALLACLTLMFHQSSNAMLKGSTQSELLAQLQIFSKKFNQAVQTSSARSLSVHNEGVSFLTAFDEDGRFQYSPKFTVPDWQRFQLFYQVRATRRLESREVSVLGQIPPGQTLPIEEFGARRPLEFYFNEGRAALSDVEEVRFSRPHPDTLELRLVRSRLRALSAEPERVSLTMTARFRNGGAP